MLPTGVTSVKTKIIVFDQTLHLTSELIQQNGFSNDPRLSGGGGSDYVHLHDNGRLEDLQLNFCHMACDWGLSHTLLGILHSRA